MSTRRLEGDSIMVVFPGDDTETALPIPVVETRPTVWDVMPEFNVHRGYVIQAVRITALKSGGFLVVQGSPERKRGHTLSREGVWREYDGEEYYPDFVDRHSFEDFDSARKAAEKAARKIIDAVKAEVMAEAEEAMKVNA